MADLLAAALQAAALPVLTASLATLVEANLAAATLAAAAADRYRRGRPFARGRHGRRRHFLQENWAVCPQVSQVSHGELDL